MSSLSSRRSLNSARAIAITSGLLLALGCGSKRVEAPSSSKQDRPPTRLASSMTFVERAATMDISHSYENGAAAGRNAILESLGGGIAIADLDRDGCPDLAFSGGGRFEGDHLIGLPTAIYRQATAGKFQDVTLQAGLDIALHYSHGIAAADADNDGFIDLLVTGYGGLTYWRNNGDGTWSDETASAGLDDASWSSSAAWGDLNGDGTLDLYVAHYVNWSFDNDPPCKGPSGVPDVCPPRAFDGLNDTVYFANGDATFRDATAEAGLVEGGKGLGVVLSDLDLDRDLDVYVTNDTTNNFLYVNDGHGHLHEQAMISGTAVDDQANANGSMGVAITDYDSNGLPDLFVANYEEELSALYRNQGDLSFLYASADAGLRSLGTRFVGFGCVAGDFDLDGHEDITVANGHVVHHPRNAPLLQKPLLLANDEGMLRDVSEGAGPFFTSAHAGRGLASGDLDGDGDLDLVFINSREPAAVLINETRTAGSSLRVRLVGRTSNRDAIGALATLTTEKGKQTRFIVGGGSYLSTSEPTLHFGIPKSDSIRSLEIVWPSGQRTHLSREEIVLGKGGPMQITAVESGK